MTEFINHLKIPQERVAVLIGKDGQIKNQLEKETNCKLNIDSSEGDVHITGEDPITLFSAAEIVKAIGRGFNPEIALNLSKMDYVLEIISVAEFAKTQNDMIRLRGRVIGKDGKARKVLEDLLEIDVCVYGKTISLIGRGESVALGRKAVESLLAGSTHAAVYNWLEKQRVMNKQREIKDTFNIKE
jgi:ribosomal RNA assembly protein